MFQQITLVGNLGSEVEMRFTPSGVPVANFSLAVNKNWANAQGERQTKTTWFRITVWRKQAELAAQFLKKGRRVLVVGEVEEASVWTDREGTPRASLDVTAQFVKFMDSSHDEDAVADANNAADDDDDAEAPPPPDVNVPPMADTQEIPF
jgi:single-strand DNA-binding protein